MTEEKKTTAKKTAAKTTAKKETAKTAIPTKIENIAKKFSGKAIKKEAAQIKINLTENSDE